MKRLSVLLGLFLLLTVFSGCGGQESKPMAPAAVPAKPIIQNENLPSTPQSDISGVNISNFAFDPAEVTIQAGKSVKWTNEDSAPHTIKSDTFESPNLSNGQSYMHQFTEKGTYDYSCSIHPSMKGKIIVE